MPEYLDGWFGANNTCCESLIEIQPMNNRAEECTNFMLSIGTTGDKSISRLASERIARYLRYSNSATRWAASSEMVHENITRKSNMPDHGFNHHKLKCWGGFSTMELDGWQNLQMHLSAATLLNSLVFEEFIWNCNIWSKKWQLSSSSW